MSEKYLYITLLLVALACLHMIDYRFKLVWYRHWRATLIALALGVGFFLLWDFAGIGGRIFFAGLSDYSSSIYLAPQLPVEEPFFLLILCYLPLLLHEGLRRRFSHHKEDHYV